MGTGRSCMLPRMTLSTLIVDGLISQASHVCVLFASTVQPDIGNHVRKQASQRDLAGKNDSKSRPCPFAPSSNTLRSLPTMRLVCTSPTALSKLDWIKHANVNGNQQAVVPPPIIALIRFPILAVLRPLQGDGSARRDQSDNRITAVSTGN